MRQRRRGDGRLRLLVTGAGGLLGGRLAALLAGAHDVVAGVRHSAGPPGLPTVAFDLREPDSFEEALAAARADAVVHSAALADPDRCEREPRLAEACNAEAPAHLARLCHRRRIRLVALSTDLVFPGDRAFSGEHDRPEPLLAYARTKLAGEEAVLAEAPGSAVARVGLVAGRGHGPRGTASEAIAWALADGRPLRLFTDQYRTPVDAESVAEAIRRMLEGGHAGRFHLGGPERLSRYDLGRRVAAVLGLPADPIASARQGDLPQSAPRPEDVSLDCSRAKAKLGWQPRPLDDVIREGRPAAGL